MSVKQFKFKREKSKLQRQQTRLWQVVDVELPYIGTKWKENKSKDKSKDKKNKDTENNDDAEKEKEDNDGPSKVSEAIKLQLPEIVIQAKFSEIKRRNLPPDKAFVRQLTTLKFPTNRKEGREKRTPLKGWETDFKSEEGKNVYLQIKIIKELWGHLS